MKNARRAATMILIIKVSILSCGAAQLWTFWPDAKTVAPNVTLPARQKSIERQHEVGLTTLTTSLPNKSKIFNDAYLDALRVLSGDNECSRFFGDQDAARAALTHLSGQLSMVRLRAQIWIKMSGNISPVTSDGRSLPYRLFKQAEVNSDGPFNWHPRYMTDKPVFKKGNYWPGTRETRVLLLLHELGHLLKGKDGNWLLPDDGENTVISTQNTSLIESKCGQQIASLSNNKSPVLVANPVRPNQQVASSQENGSSNSPR
jgi:hypothetical protein